MTMNLAPEQTITSDAQLARPDVPLVVEFTSSRVRQRPMASRMAGIEVAAGRLPLRAVDVDARPDLRRRFRVQLLPTFVVLYEAAELARFVGPHTRRELASAIRRALNPNMVRVDERPRARGLWNAFTVHLWGFSV